MKRILFFIILFSINIINVNAASITDKINDLNNNINNLMDEISNINHIDKLYPIGSIYVSVSSANPADMFGGIWESYAEGRKIVGYGNNGITTYNYNSQGGTIDKTLEVNNIPSHTHTIIPQGTVTSTFVGTSINTSSNGAHSHNVSLGVSANEAKGYGLKVAIYQHDVNSPFYDRAIVTGGYTGSSIQGSHSHTVTPQGTVESKFTGTETTTSSVGNGEKFSIQNPYITVYMWKRTA